jgi:hypothetical protein
MLLRCNRLNCFFPKTSRIHASSCCFHSSYHDTMKREFFWEMFSIILFRPRCYYMNLPSSEECKTRKILMISNYIDLCVAHSIFSAFISVRDLPWLSLWRIELASQSFTTCLHPSILCPLMLPLSPYCQPMASSILVVALSNLSSNAFQSMNHKHCLSHLMIRHSLDNYTLRNLWILDKSTQLLRRLPEKKKGHDSSLV